MRSLLNKTFTQFALCAVALFVLVTPAFYFLTKHFYAEDLIDIIEAVQRRHRLPSLDLESDILIGLTIQMTIIFAVIGVTLILMQRIITKKAWQPFNNTLNRVERFNLEQGKVPQFHDTNIKEFARLNEALVRLMQKDKETYRIQKEFTENASHELQTPLAIIRTKLDLLMQENIDEQSMSLVEDMYNICIRMEHLNRSLLLLAKIENSQYAELEDVNLGDEIRQLQPSYGTLTNLNILFSDESAAPVVLRANTILVESLLNNLVVNAIRHTLSSAGEIKITLTDNRLIVSNPAEGKALDSSTLFQRFRTGDVKRVGNGLGLSIVKAICDFHGWIVEYEYEENRHKFVVTFI